MYQRTGATEPPTAGVAQTVSQRACTMSMSDRLVEEADSAGTPAPPPSSEKVKKPIVFLLPGLSGDVQEFASLLSPTETSLQLVPIHYRHWSQLRPEPVELDRLVTDCVAQIESHGPPPTIFLVGYSFGGLIAWAVARAMATSGQGIGLLGLVDAPACPEIEESAKSTIGRFSRLIRGIRRGETFQQLARSFAGILFRSRTWVRFAFRRLHRSKALPRIFNRIDLNIQVRYHMILVKECIARMAALGEQSHCPALLFRCSERPMDEEIDLGWARYLTSLRVVTLSGDHASVLQKQNVDQIIFEVAVTITEGEEILRNVPGHLCVNRTGCLLSKGQANRT
jgi:thioesterase domain-containing protein